jgi:RecB family exonuclease
LIPLSTSSRQIPLITEEEVIRRINDGATLVAVNRRLARFLASRYNAQKVADGCLAWETPDIITFAAWCEREYNAAAEAAAAGDGALLPVLLKPAQELRVWQQIIADSTRGGGLLQIPRAAETAREAWDLCVNWQAPLDAPDFFSSEDKAAFIEWSGRFEDICRDRKWQDTAGLGRALADLLASKRVPAPKQFILAGFDEWTPKEMIIIIALAATGCPVTAMAHPDRQGRAVRCVFADADAELIAAAQWAARNMADHPGARIGVIVPDLAAVRQQVIRIFDARFHPAMIMTPDAGHARLYNLSLGAPLAGYPLIHAALLGLKLACRSFTIAEYSQWLRSPFWAGAGIEASRRALLDAKIRGIGEAQIPLDRFAEKVSAFLDTPAACPILAERLDRFRRLRADLPGRRRPSGWVADFSAWLRVLGWPGDGPLSSDLWQVHEAWQDALAGYSEMDHVMRETDLETALADFMQYIASVTFQPETEDVPVQIMGLLEAAGEDFDHLWITGMHQENWPAQARPNPFLPIRIQRELDMPHASPEREYDYAWRLTRRLLRAADDIVVSHGAVDGETDLYPSPLIRHLPAAAAAVDSHRDASHSAAGSGGHDALQAPQPPTDQPSIAEEDEPFGPADYWRTIFQAADFETLSDQQGPALPEHTAVKGGTGLLKAQAACPFSAFARYRLHAEKLETPGVGINAMDRGGLVHRVLELLWERLENHGVLAGKTDTELAADIAVAASSAVNELRRRLPGTMAGRFADIEHDRLRSLIGQWMELERQRTSFAVIGRETSLDCPINGIILRTRADRIDRLDDGRIVIIDYKTGEVNISDWLTDRIAEPQLPLYSVMAGEPVGAVIFARIKKGRLAWAGLADNAGLAPGLKEVAAVSRDHETLEALMGWWREKLDGLAAEVRRGHATVSPVSLVKSCRYCDLGILCRVTEGAVLESAGDNDDDN